MNLIIYQADVVGKQNNCLYPHRREVTNADELAVAVAMDHVCAEYQNNYRSMIIPTIRLSGLRRRVLPRSTRISSTRSPSVAIT